MLIGELLGMEPPTEIIEEEIQKPVKLSPFDFTNSISYDKKDLFADNEDAEKQYNPYLINRALSFSADTVLFANEMNRYSNIPKQFQFQFLSSTIRKRKRYDKWIKSEEIEDIDIVKEYYNYSNEKAKQALRLLGPEEIAYIRSKLNKGGIQTKTRKRNANTND